MRTTLCWLAWHVCLSSSSRRTRLGSNLLTGKFARQSADTSITTAIGDACHERDDARCTDTLRYLTLSLLSSSLVAPNQAFAFGRRVVVQRRSSSPQNIVDYYAVRLPRPCGIVFEEAVAGQPEGVVVADLVPDSHADMDDRISVGDKLLRVSALVYGGPKPLVSIGGGSVNTIAKRKLIPCTKMDYDTIMKAIQSNSGRHGYTDVVFEFERTEASIIRNPKEKRAPRLNGQDVNWDATRGTTSNGKSTPLRPAKDEFDIQI